MKRKKMSTKQFLYAYLAIVSVEFAVADLTDTVYEMFNQFKSDYNINYPTIEAEQQALANFIANLPIIDQLNAFETGTAIYGITKYMGLSPTQFSAQYLTGLVVPTYPKRFRTPAVPDIVIPDFFDWRNYGVVTEVKDQGLCGACWAYSLNVNIEGLNAIKTGTLTSCSEQMLVDCDTNDQGCAGGWMDNAIQYLIDTGGMETEDDYAWTGSQGTCMAPSFVRTIKVIGGECWNTGSEVDLQAFIMDAAPAAATVDGNGMQFYKSGVIGYAGDTGTAPASCCSTKECQNHAVALVGWGQEERPSMVPLQPPEIIEYWIAKNSWGADWGELGYVRILRNKNTCGINMFVSSAVL